MLFMIFRGFLLIILGLFITVEVFYTQFLFTSMFFRWLARKILRKNSCLVGVHSFKYSHIELPIELHGIQAYSKAKFINRKCSNCGIKHHRALGSIYTYWHKGELTEKSRLISRNI